MRIAVFLKESLDVECPFAVTDEMDDLDSLYVPTVVDQSDLRALALTRAAFPAGTAEIVAVCVDPASSENAVRTAVSYGADRALTVRDDGLKAPADHLARAAAAAAVVKAIEADLAVCGGLDEFGGPDALGACLAEQTGWPFVGNATSWSRDERSGGLLVRRKLDHGNRELVECPIPAVISADGARDSLPYPSFPFLLKAQMAKIEELSLEDLGLKAADVRGAGSLAQGAFIPPRPRTKRTAEGKKTGSALMASMMGGGAKKKGSGVIEAEPAEAAARIVEFLEEKGILENS